MFVKNMVIKTAEQVEQEMLVKQEMLADVKVEIKQFIDNSVNTVELCDIWKYISNKYPHTYIDTDIVNICNEIKQEMISIEKKPEFILK